jgi:hypothetical protein
MEIEFLDRFFSYSFNSQEGIESLYESLYIVFWILVPFVILLVVYSVYFTLKMRKKDKENSR